MIDNLKRLGYDVTVIHDRPRRKLEKLNSKKYPGPFLSKGGTTKVIIRIKDAEFVGEAKCSDEDNYSKKMGVEIATGRAIKKIAQISQAIAKTLQTMDCVKHSYDTLLDKVDSKFVEQV